MKTQTIEMMFKPAFNLMDQLFSKIACLGGVILICTGASAQNLFVSGSGCCVCESLNYLTCGQIFEFTWDGRQSIFTSELAHPGGIAFDSTGNLFVADCETAGHVQTSSSTKSLGTGLGPPLPQG